MSSSSVPSQNLDHQLSAYHYELPEGAIAQNPVTPRDHSRLLVIDSPATHQHSHFYQLDQWLKPNDLLVLNNTRVIPARLLGHKSTGAAVEVLLIEPIAMNQWLALVRPGRRIPPGCELVFGPTNNPHLKASVLERHPETGGRILELHPTEPEKSVLDVIDELGQIPLPPYITDSTALPDQYQTIYAQRQGAVAAPTAGLHFTDSLFARLKDKGIDTAEVTLHVGIGTFRPVEVTDIKTHNMHKERIEVPAQTVEKIRQTQEKGGRVIAVGTTSTRALEGAAAVCGEIAAFEGRTDLFIYPGYHWQVIDGMITNFHLPGSSLMMMISALIGRERLLKVYEDAIAQSYHFYSFGDAMLILPEAQIQDQAIESGSIP